MTSNIPPEILEYIEQVEADHPRACREQHALVALVRRIFETEDVYVDTERMRKYFRLARYFPYDRLFPWQTFALGLWMCTYRRDGSPRFKTLFAMLGRGGGKDGVIAISSAAFISPYNPVPHYNVDICANNEEQAVTPVKDIVEALENPTWEAKLSKYYYHTKEILRGRKNLGEVKGRTNNPKGRDGMRSGAVIFNEVHQYQNYDNIKVFVTGGGARSKLWSEIVANVFNCSVAVPTPGDASFGACLLAGTGIGVFRDVRDAVAKCLHVDRTIAPDPAAAAKYDHLYTCYKRIHDALAPVYSQRKNP